MRKSCGYNVIGGRVSMARSGDIIESKALGQKMRFEVTGHESGGEVTICHYFIQPLPNSVCPPLSTHRYQSELFRVVSGRFGVHVGGVDHMLHPGEEVIVPPGTPHLAWNDGPEEAYVMLEFRPARNIDGFFETEFGPANDGRFNYLLRNGRRTVRPKSAMQGAALCHEYGIGLCDFPIPEPMQLILFPVMATCGRMVGIKGSYTKYRASSPTESPDQRKLSASMRQPPP
jgi:mannose-6-phosphate isomerase-like protein (cupin superfamily)